MNYNYPQLQYQGQQYVAHGGYKPAPQYAQWPQGSSSLPQIRPVSSIEEVRAYPIDFDGSIFYFADMANKRIYTKQINIDGTATINLYELKIPTQADQLANSYITRQEFEQVINSLKEMYKPVVKENIEEPQQPAAQPTKPLFDF